MALPTRGQPDWDDELGNHIAGLEADLQSAKANAEVAVSNANEARNVAQSVHTAVLGGSDAANAVLISDSASATARALMATITPHIGEHFKPLLMALDAGGASTAIQVLGDSTGNETNEWVYLFAQSLAARYPAWGVKHRVWNDATQKYDAPTTIQTPPLGDRHAILAPGNNVWLYLPHAASNSLTGDADVAYDVALDDWTPAAAQALGGKFGGAGSRGWMLRVTTTGNLELTYSTDGTGTSAATSSVPVGAADGSRKWVRFTYDADNGAAGRTITFYTSSDGVTWTQLGTTVTHAPAAPMFNATMDLETGSRANGSDFLKGKVYEVRVRNGIDGPMVAPANPESWGTKTNNATSVTWGGSPILQIINGSKSGAAISYLNDATRLPKMTPDFGTVLTMLSCSHNDGGQLGGAYLAQWDTLLAGVLSRLPQTVVVVHGQNPRTTPATFIETHAARLSQERAWAMRNRAGYVDAYAAFLADGRPLSDLVSAADGIHPTGAGSLVWRDAVLSAAGLA